MSLDDEAKAELEALTSIHRLRTPRVFEGRQGVRVVVDGREVTSFASNDYLGLAGDQRLVDAAIESLERDGSGAGASRLIIGNHREHVDLEREVADWVGTEAVQLFNSGYAANTGVLTALLREGDVVFSDELNHASIVDGCRLSRATIAVYKHCDVADLERLLKLHTGRRRIVVTETVFSMDGDVVDLAAVTQLARTHGAHLVVDEAHAMGVIGHEGRGVAGHDGVDSASVKGREGCGAAGRGRVEQASVSGEADVAGDNRERAGLIGEGRAVGDSRDVAGGSVEIAGLIAGGSRAVSVGQPDIVIGTFGKALGSFGAFVATTRAISDLLWNKARPLIFSTGLPPHVVAASRRAVQIARSGEGETRRAKLRAAIAAFRTAVPSAGGDAAVPIASWLIGDDGRTAQVGRHLFEAGVLVGAVRPPTVPAGTSRLRVSFSAAHDVADVQRLVDATRGLVS